MEKEKVSNSFALIRILKYLAKKRRATEQEIRDASKVSEYQFNHFLDNQKIIYHNWTPESDQNSSKKYFELTSHGFALYLNYEGLKEAELAGKSARKWAIAALFATFCSTAISLYLSIQNDRQSKSWENHETKLLEEIRDAIKFQK